MNLRFDRKTEMFMQQLQSVQDLWGLYCRDFISE